MLDKIKTMLGQITPGPWEWDVKKLEKNKHGGVDVGDLSYWNPDRCGVSVLTIMPNKYGNNVISTVSEHNAEFIAASPEFAQWSVREIERLREALEDIETLACMNRWNAIESIEERASEALKGSP